MPSGADVLVARSALPDAVRRVRALLGAKGLGGTLARGTLWSLGINVAGAAIGFGMQVLLARALGRDVYGLYLYTLAWMNSALLLGKLELDTAAVRYVGAYAARGEWPLLRGFLRRSGQIVGALSLAVSFLAAAIVWALRARFPAGAADAYLVGCALLPVTALLQLKANVLQGFKRVPESQGPTLVLRPLLFAAGVAAIVFGAGLRLGASSAIGVNLAATVAALVATAWLAARATPREVAASAPAYHTREWVHTAFGVLAISVAQLVLSPQSDVLIVGTFLGTSDAGLYGVASQLASLIGFGVTAVTFIASPMIAELYAQGRRADLQRLLRHVALANAAVSLPVLAGLVVLGKVLLGWFGPTFVAAYPILLVLSVAHSTVALVGALAGFLMVMTGHQKHAGIIIGGTAVLNLALTVVLTPRFGPVGTAAATAVATLLRALILIVYIRRRLGLEVVPLRHAGDVA